MILAANKHCKPLPEGRSRPSLRVSGNVKRRNQVVES